MQRRRDQGRQPSEKAGGGQLGSDSQAMTLWTYGSVSFSRDGNLTYQELDNRDIAFAERAFHCIEEFATLNTRQRNNIFWNSAKGGRRTCKPLNDVVQGADKFLRKDEKKRGITRIDNVFGRNCPRTGCSRASFQDCFTSQECTVYRLKVRKGEVRTMETEARTRYLHGTKGDKNYWRDEKSIFESILNWRIKAGLTMEAVSKDLPTESEDGYQYNDRSAAEGAQDQDPNQQDSIRYEDIVRKDDEVDPRALAEIMAKPSHIDDNLVPVKTTVTDGKWHVAALQPYKYQTISTPVNTQSSSYSLPAVSQASASAFSRQPVPYNTGFQNPIGKGGYPPPSNPSQGPSYPLQRQPYQISGAPYASMTAYSSQNSARSPGPYSSYVSVTQHLSPAQTSYQPVSPPYGSGSQSIGQSGYGQPQGLRSTYPQQQQQYPSDEAQTGYEEDPYAWLDNP